MTRIFDIILLILSRLLCPRERVVPEILTEPLTELEPEELAEPV
jgi:hypothetical protein